MKKTVSAIVIISLFVPFGSVFAEQVQTSVNGQQPTVTQASDELKAPTQAELNTRLQERKARLKTKLSALESKNITAKCTGAQAKLSTFLDSRYKNDKPYQAKYEAFSQRLTSLSTKLKQNNIDTTQLDAQIVVFNQKYATFKSAVEAYRTAINDTKSIDCKTNPTDFKTSLDDARSKAVLVKQASMDLETYGRTTIKATLEAIKTTKEQS